MGYRNHCNVLPRRHYTGGRDNLIRDLIEKGSHRLETWGNSREGFDVYLTAKADQYSSGAKLAGPYSLRGDAVDACQRTYFGERETADYVVKVAKGRNWR